MNRPPSPERDRLDSELWQFLDQLEGWLEGPMVALGFVWLVLVVADLLWGLGGFLSALTTVIWALFVLDFLLRLALAPKKAIYLRRNWLTALSLVVPALRVARVVRVIRLARLAPATRTLRLVSVVGSMNRGMRALRASLGRHGAGYVLALTVSVVLVRAAGMLAFERTPEGEGMDSYGEALWWTAMLVTTIGSEFWPVTPEGRVLALVLSVYSLGVFGFVTATLASFFVGRDVEGGAGDPRGEVTMRDLRDELRALREELQRLRRSPPSGSAGP